MNSVVLMGRLTRDPDVRYTNDVDPICIARYTLAVGRMKDKNGNRLTDYIRVVAFAANGRFAEKYFWKGLRVCIHGRLQTRNYKNNAGETVYITEVIADRQEFADGKGAGGSQEAVPAEGAAGEDGFMNIPEGVEDNGIPFN